MEKNRELSHSLSQSPSLFDAQGTEAFASEHHKINQITSKLQPVISEQILHEGT